MLARWEAGGHVVKKPGGARAEEGSFGLTARSELRPPPPTAACRRSALSCFTLTNPREQLDLQELGPSVKPILNS